jgi:hypothetical protein
MNRLKHETGENRHGYRTLTGRISTCTPASSLDDTAVFIAVNETTHESLPLAFKKIVSFSASSKSFRRLSKSEPYGRSEGNLSGGKRKVALNTHASVTRGRWSVCSMTDALHRAGASRSPRLLFLLKGTPRMKWLM